MSKVIIGVVQQTMRVHESTDAYKADVRRFMRQVKSKHADMVVFPELSGLMLAYPLISGVKRGLLKRADRAGRRRSPLAKVLGRVAGTTARTLGSGMQGSLTRLLRKRHGELFDSYIEFFADVAAEYEMYVVGGSVYLYDEDLDEVRNVCYVFDPHGEIVGHQEKLVLTRQDEELCSPGDRMVVLPTELGKLGVIIGSDVLYPEPARALAVQGADLLVAPAACPGPVLYRQVREAFHARVQENQLYGAISFLVGPNNLGQGQYAGRSAVLAPMELTTRRSGVLQEVGAANVESFVAAECDSDALRQLWETSDPPLRHRLPLACGAVLSSFYGAGRAVAEGYAEPEEMLEEVLPELPAEVLVLEEPVEEIAEEGVEVVLEEEGELVTPIPVSVADSEVVEEEPPDTAEEWPFESAWDESGSGDKED
jgi:predicted amidohydrolase